MQIVFSPRFQKKPRAQNMQGLLGGAVEHVPDLLKVKPVRVQIGTGQMICNVGMHETVTELVITKAVISGHA